MKGWETQRLVDVAELQGRIGWKGLTAKEYTQEGPYFLSVHSLNYGDYVDFRDAFHISQQRYDESPEIMLQPDDVLICKDGAGIGKVGIVRDLPGQSTINSSLLLIRAKPNILPKYLYHVLQSPYFQTIVQSRLEGATTPHLYQRDIATFPIHVPPLEEQRRIVAVLDEAFAAIATATANAEKNLANAGQLFEAELDALVDEVRAAFSGSALANHCRRMTVGHVGPMKDRYQDSGIPFLRSQNVRPFQIELNGVAFIDEAFDSELVKSRLAPGDVAVVRTGYPGTAAVIPPSLPISNCADLVIIRPGPDLNPHYVAAFLNSNLGKRMIAGNLVGAAQKHFNVGAAKKVEIPIPPLVDQARLVARVDQLRALSGQLSEAYEEKLLKLGVLKQSLLRHAFTGELTAVMPEIIAA